MLSNLSASRPEPTPSFSDVQTFAQDPNEITPFPDPRNHILLLSVNANCLTPPSNVKPLPAGLKDRTMVLEPPSDSPTAVLNTVFETTPVTKVSGDGFEVGLLVPETSLIVLVEEPLILIL